MNKSFLDYILRNRLPVTVFVVLCSFALTYFASRAERDGVGYSPDQPIAYSHKLHAGDMKLIASIAMLLLKNPVMLWYLQWQLV